MAFLHNNLGCAMKKLVIAMAMFSCLHLVSASSSAEDVMKVWELCKNDDTEVFKRLFTFRFISSEVIRQVVLDERFEDFVRRKKPDGSYEYFTKIMGLNIEYVKTYLLKKIQENKKNSLSLASLKKDDDKKLPLFSVVQQKGDFSNKRLKIEGIEEILSDSDFDYSDLSTEDSEAEYEVVKYSAPECAVVKEVIFLN